MHKYLCLLRLLTSVFLSKQTSQTQKRLELQTQNRVKRIYSCEKVGQLRTYLYTNRILRWELSKDYRQRRAALESTAINEASEDNVVERLVNWERP